MACLATLQSTVEKPKEIEESSDDDSLDGKWTFIPFIIFYFVIHIIFNVAMMVEYPQLFIIQETKRSLSSYQMNIRFLYSWRTIYLSVMQRSLMQT